VEETRTIYPLLLKGSAVGWRYGFEKHNYLVVGHDGIIRFRSAGFLDDRYNDRHVRASIEMTLEDLREAREAGASDGHPQAEPGSEVEGGDGIESSGLSVEDVADEPVPVNDSEPDEEENTWWRIKPQVTAHR